MGLALKGQREKKNRKTKVVSEKGATPGRQKKIFSRPQRNQKTSNGIPEEMENLGGNFRRKKWHWDGRGEGLGRDREFLY